MESPSAVVAAVLVWILFVGLGAYISTQKNRQAIEGVLLALLFGPLGLIVAALLPTKAPAAPPAPRKTAKQLAAEQEERERRALESGEAIDDDRAMSFLDD